MRDAGGDAVEVEGVGALRREGGLPAAGGHAAEADGARIHLRAKQIIQNALVFQKKIMEVFIDIR